jgi:hypothetical protein
MFMPRHRTAGQNHHIKLANKFFQNVAKFEYLGTTEANQNCIHEKIKSGLNSRNASYHAVQNRLSSSLLFKNLKNKTHITIILPAVLYT